MVHVPPFSRWLPRERSSIAFVKQAIGPRRRAVVNVSTIADPGQQSASDESRQCSSRSAMREPELAKQFHEAPGPDRLARPPDIRAEQRDNKILGL